MNREDTPRSLLVHGDRLRAFRQAVKLTQEEAANRSGYTDRLIRKLERGGPVNLQTLRDVLDAYSELSAEIRAVHLEELIIQHRTPEQLIREWFERVFNQREFSAIDELMHPNVELFAEGETRHGREVIRQRIAALLGAFQPLKITVESIVTGPDHVVAYWHVVKTHSGEFLGIPATDKEVELRGSSYARFVNEQIIEARDHWDVQDLIQKLTGHPSKPV